MQTIGIDVGKRQHVAAICHEGEREARRAILRFGADRAGFSELERWLERQAIVRLVVGQRVESWSEVAYSRSTTLRT